MHMYFFLCLFLLLLFPHLGEAQLLGEPTRIRHFYGQYWQRQQVWGERGLGKFELLQHLPEHWYSGWRYAPRQAPPQGIFGVETPQLRALPDNSLALQAQGGTTGEWTADLLARLSLQQVNTSLRLSGYGLSTKTDRNADGYLDLPVQRRLLLDNAWAIYLRRFTSLNTVRFLTWNAQGGQTHYNPDTDYGSTRAYGNGVEGRHLAYQSQNFISTKDDNGFEVNWRLSDHGQQRYFGLRQYEGSEWHLRAQASYHYQLPNPENVFKVGLFYQSHNVRETFESLDLKRQEGFGGGYVGYESRLHEWLQLSTHVHIGYHNLARWQVMPHAKLSLFLPRNWRAHLVSGSGIRYANPLYEQLHLLESQRQVVLTEPLQAEQAWYYGAVLQYNTWVDQQQRWMLALDGHCYFSWYSSKVVADVDADPYALLLYNSTQTAQEVTLYLHQRWTYLRTNLAVELSYRFDGWYTPIGNRLRQEPYYAPHHILLGLDLPIVVQQLRWAKLRLQATANAGRRLPNLSAKAGTAGWTAQYPSLGQAVLRLDARLTLDGSTELFRRWKLRHLSAWVGVDNLLNAQQPIAPIGGNQPFEPFFDASLNGLSFSGRRFYIGLQYRCL